jgi:hypothetical protein
MMMQIPISNNQYLNNLQMSKIQGVVLGALVWKFEYWNFEIV